MVGHAASPTCTVYVDVTVTPSKVKVTEHLNFRQLSKPCMLVAMTAAPLRSFLVLTSGYATWFTAGGAIRITHYDVIDDVVTRKL